MKNTLIIFFVYIFSVIIVIPTTITTIYAINKTTIENELLDEETIYDITDESNTHTEIVTNNETNLSIAKSTENNNFENYIKGVVAAEMPASFNIEALKSQAVAARTYAVKTIIDSQGFFDKNTPNPEALIGSGQAYKTTDELKNDWGNNYDLYNSKIEQAVLATSCEIMTYENKPILAVFHSTSSGLTEQPEDIWATPLPYLKSVDSMVDINAPTYSETLSFTEDKIFSLLKNKYSHLEIQNNDLINNINILERTSAGYVKNIQIGNIIITGMDFRELLGLASGNFTIEKNNNIIEITTKGYGHGVGLSQYGADFMADEGLLYDKILHYYYKDINIINYNEL